MTDTHPVRYLVKARRNNIVVHVQEADSKAAAQRLAESFEAVSHTDAEIVVVHDPATTDLTAHTREIVEDIAKHARS